MSSATKDRSGELRYESNNSVSISTISAESVAITAGAIGTVVNFQIAKFPIRNVLGGGLGSKGDSSLSFVAGIFTNEVGFDTLDADLAAGDYWVNYATGEGRGKKAATGTSASATYKIVVSTATGGGGGGGGETDLTGINGVAPSVGAGAVDPGTLRMTLGSDDPAVASLQALDDWDESDRAKVNVIVGQAGVDGGEGVVSSKTLRTVAARVPKAFADSTATANTTSSTVLASNANREMGTSIINTSPTVGVFLNFTDPAVVNQGIFLAPYGAFIMDEVQFDTGAVTAITASGTAVLSIMETT